VFFKFGCFMRIVLDGTAKVAKSTEAHELKNRDIEKHIENIV